MSDNPTNVFRDASRRKLRFNLNGLLTTEDLWDLPLTKLDEMAVKIDAGLAGTTKSFRTNPDRKVTAQQAEDQLRLSVITEVIKTKEEENARKAAAADKKARLDLLNQLKAKRELDALEAMDLATIEKEIAELEKA